MRTHTAKSAHLPPSISRLHFWLDTPSPYSAGWRWRAAIEKNFFDFRSFTECLYWNYFFWILYSLFLSRFFFIFSKHCFNSSSFHPVFLISFYLFSFYTRLITIWSLLHIVENNGFDIISRFRISDSEFRLVSALFILRFIS